MGSGGENKNRVQDKRKVVDGLMRLKTKKITRGSLSTSARERMPFENRIKINGIFIVLIRIFFFFLQ